MTQQKESVVTPERFDSGMTWAQYMASIKRNIPKFQYNYDETAVSEEDAAALKALSQADRGPARVLMLGEDWCPDVFRGAPVMARLAEAAGWDLRVFARDENLDIMNEFLNQGEHQSIPTVVFYTRDHRYIAHWIERPAKANSEMGEVQALFAGLDREKDHQEMRRRYDEFQQGPMWAAWRDETIREIRELLEDAASR
jgi:thiol-disulfide isomerase/thioredoxin